MFLLNIVGRGACSHRIFLMIRTEEYYSAECSQQD